jgi:hypothetical protein
MDTNQPFIAVCPDERINFSPPQNLLLISPISYLVFRFCIAMSLDIAIKKLRPFRNISVMGDVLSLRGAQRRSNPLVLSWE